MKKQIKAIEEYGRIARELKAACVAYVLEHLEDELSPRVINTFARGIALPENGGRFGSSASGEAVSSMDRFVLFGERRDGERVLDVMRESGAFGFDECAILTQWKEKAFQSLFEITDIDHEHVKLFDIVAEVSYIVQVNDPSIAPLFFSSMEMGSFLLTSIAPVHPLWFLSGPQMPYLKSEEVRLMRQLAKSFPICSPAHYRNNPEKLARARAMQKEEYERFVRHFKTDEVFTSGENVDRVVDEYYAARAQELGQAAPALPRSPRDVRVERDVGIVVDELEGMHYFFNYAQFVDAFAQHADERGLQIVRDYLEDDSSPAFLFHRMKEKFPESFRTVMRRVTSKTHAHLDPHDDFEEIMDVFKPGWRETFPSFHPLNGRMQKHLYTSLDVDRNDPCPCGSGKKYKKCHL